jgi:hypothetical protein
LRSPMGQVLARAFVPVAGLLAIVVSAGTANAETVVVEAAGGNPLESLSTPVGLSAIGLGVAGMVAGMFRRKKATVQPENQRKAS